jgi:hypothetical protein
MDTSSAGADAATRARDVLLPMPHERLLRLLRLLSSCERDSVTPRPRC